MERKKALKREKLVKKIEVEVFAHATESESRVSEAVRRLMGSLPENMSKQVVHGFHGNPVVIFKYSEKGEKAQENASFILSSLDKFDAAELIRSLERRLKKGKLYMRLDKQDAFLGEHTLSESDDVIRVTITFYPHIRGKEKILWALRKLGLKDDKET